MARKKKEPEQIYVKAGIKDCLATLSIKHTIDMATLRALNPGIRNIFMLILPGEKVRIQ